ncbi:MULTISPECIES: tyrosine-type recombinase/integrase [unclassified Pseudomonas]|uniref:tyrosine-type recombinase/integrase n=1 Tax=unclassified Pseudomonas TaxID=196821 RepID=UPI00067E0EC7|nr:MULTISPECIES: site-specific integrase [unclassified Pseudomonas]MBF4557213.1 tyrosine-type recombinase/integrase [Pseudomonas sp. p50(2008)]
MAGVKKVLTDAFLRTVKPAETRFDIWDEGNTGLGVRVSKVISWCYMYRHEGRVRRLTLGKFPGMSCREARLAYAKAAEAVKDGRDPAAAKIALRVENKEALTVQELCTSYIERYAKPRKRSWREDERQLLRDVVPTLGRTLAKNVQRREIVALIDKKVDAGAGVAANRLLAVVRKMFAWAVERGELNESPVAGVSRQHRERSRERVLSFEEIQTFYAAVTATDWIKATPPVRKSLGVMLLTGQRKGEVLAMRWEDISNESDGYWWTIPAAVAKNRRTHRVPLDNLVLDLIGKPETGKTGPVFESLRKPGSPVIDTAPAHALRDEFAPDRFFNNLAPFTPHDLRRTVATALSCLGYPRLILMKVLNHTDPSVSAVYDRYSYDQEKREALTRWGEMLYATQDPMHGYDKDTGQELTEYRFVDEWRRMLPA